MSDKTHRSFEIGTVVDEVLNLPLFAKYTCHSPPTLLLIDRSGNVKDVWVGKLNAGKETEVVQRILNY